MASPEVSERPLECKQSDEYTIPVEMLGPDNPALVGGEVNLYEDELSDRGCSKSYLRYRVMADCWFILLRSYLRLDKVAVRILDTRLFHKFGTNEIIRDFMWKEETWDILQNQKGFNVGSEWLLKPN
jgi:type 2A phosphatase activator TIP41